MMAYGLVTPNIHFLEMERPAGSWAPTSYDEGAASYIQADIRNIQQTLLAEIPSSAEGLDLDRIYSFVERLGLRIAPHVEVGAEDVENCENLLMKYGASQHSPDIFGFYLSPFDVALTYRDKAWEDANGVAFTESIIVHELAHGSGPAFDVFVALDGLKRYISPARQGFRVMLPESTKDRGLFLEEGFADVVRGRYISDVLGLPHGLTGSEEQWKHDKELRVAVPTKFVLRDPEGDIGFHASALAGAALDLLIARDSELWDALLESRVNAQRISEIAHRIDVFRPGLFTYLQNLRGVAEFHLGYKAVISAVEK